MCLHCACGQGCVWEEACSGVGRHHSTPTCRAGSEPQPPNLREPCPAAGRACQRLRLPGPGGWRPPPPLQRVGGARQLAPARRLLLHREQAGPSLCPGELGEVGVERQGSPEWGALSPECKQGSRWAAPPPWAPSPQSGPGGARGTRQGGWGCGTGGESRGQCLWALGPFLSSPFLVFLKHVLC